MSYLVRDQEDQDDLANILIIYLHRLKVADMPENPFLD
jgi:hypothetical protein